MNNTTKEKNKLSMKKILILYDFYKIYKDVK